MQPMATIGISIDHLLCLNIIYSHFLLINSEKKMLQSNDLLYEYFNSILLITQKPGHFSASPLGYTLNISKCKK